MVYRKQKSNTYCKLRTSDCKCNRRYHHGQPKCLINTNLSMLLRSQKRLQSIQFILKIFLRESEQSFALKHLKSEVNNLEKKGKKVTNPLWSKQIVCKCIENCQVFLLYLSSWSRRLEFISSWCERCFRSKRRPGPIALLLLPS